MNRTAFVEEAARSIMAIWWADMVEEQELDVSMSGCDIFEIAPLERDEIDPAAYAAAVKLAGELQGANPAHGHDIERVFAACETLAERLGCELEFAAWATRICLQSMGTGVHWDEDFCHKHREEPIAVPNTLEFVGGWMDFEREYDKQGQPI